MKIQFSEFIDPSPEQEITEVFVEVSSGRTSFGFTRPANPIGEGKFPLMTGPGESTIILWAFGTGDDLDYHFEGRGAISLDLFCSSGTNKEVFTGSPTPAPVARREILTASPTASPTASTGNVQQPQDEEDDDTSGAVRAAPSVTMLARRSSASGVGGWAGSVGAVFGLAIGVVAAALAN